MSETFAALLKRYRGRSGLSQLQLAMGADLSPSAIARFEVETRFPTPRTIAVIADTLGLNTADRSALMVAAGYWPGETGAVLVLDALHAARSASGNKWRM